MTTSNLLLLVRLLNLKFLNVLAAYTIGTSNSPHRFRLYRERACSTSRIGEADRFVRCLRLTPKSSAADQEAVGEAPHELQ